MSDSKPSMFDGAEAVGWSATMGLIPGYGHDNDPVTLGERHVFLVSLWNDAMEETFRRTGFAVSAVMTPSIVVYPRNNGCPAGGEHVVTLSGSSNPTKVEPERFDDFARAVEDTVLAVQKGMDQTSVRIEFTLIRRSIYSRTD